MRRFFFFYSLSDRQIQKHMNLLQFNIVISENRIVKNEYGTTHSIAAGYKVRTMGWKSGFGLLVRAQIKSCAGEMHLTRGGVQQVARFSEKLNEQKVFTIYYGNSSRQSSQQLRMSLDVLQASSLELNVLSVSFYRYSTAATFTGKILHLASSKGK